MHKYEEAQISIIDIENCKNKCVLKFILQIEFTIFI